MPDQLAWTQAVAVLLAGAALGWLFFGGLWWTVQRGVTSRRPGRWTLGSLVLRHTLALAGFSFVGAGQPWRLGLCLLGFLLARGIVLRATRLPPVTAPRAESLAPTPRTNAATGPPCS